jgi:hypothetical protein
MGRKPRVDRSPEETWQIVQEGIKSGNVSETSPPKRCLRSLFRFILPAIEQIRSDPVTPTLFQRDIKGMVLRKTYATNSSGIATLVSRFLARPGKRF